MYLTFDRTTKELINYSSSSEHSLIHNNKAGIVYFDEYTVTVKRDDIDFVETYFDEIMQVDVLVAGQYMLTDELHDFLEVLERIDEVLDNGIKLIKDKIEIHNDLIPLSYAIYMGQLALKDEAEYTDSEKQINFHMKKNDYIFTFNKTMKLINSIDIIGGNFMKIVKTADTTEAIDTAFDELKTSLDKL